jgi:diketogulonate reductase-like aldo/keto reductase
MTTSDMLRYARIPTHGSGPIPAAGFGTLIPDPLATKQATRAALEAGFRHLDCAERYRNEAAVGEAIRKPLRRGRYCARTCSLPPSYGTPTIVQSG